MKSAKFGHGCLLALGASIPEAGDGREVKSAQFRAETLPKIEMQKNRDAFDASRTNYVRALLMTACEQAAWVRRDPALRHR